MSDCEMPTVCNHSTPRARKPHRCCECRGTIRAGETYHLITGLWDGTWSTFKICPECNAIRKEFEAEVTDPGQAPGLGYLSEYIFDHYNGYVPDHITRFIAIMRARGATIPAQWLKIAEDQTPGSNHWLGQEPIPISKATP